MPTSAPRLEVLVVPGVERAVGHTRRWLRDVIGAGHPCYDDSASCLGEIMTNALRHTDSGKDGGRIRVEVTIAGDRVRAEVTDDGGSEWVPRVRSPAESAEGGRGLQIVAGLAAEWGAERRGPGHAVWFTVRA